MIKSRVFFGSRHPHLNSPPLPLLFAAQLARHLVSAVDKLEKQAARVGSAVRASGAWRAAVNRSHSLARASAKAKGVEAEGVAFVGRPGGAC